MKEKENESLLKVNIEENDQLIDKLNEITEKNIKEFKDNISPMNLTLTNFENKINDLINDKVLTFINEKNKILEEQKNLINEYEQKIENFEKQINE